MIHISIIMLKQRLSHYIYSYSLLFSLYLCIVWNFPFFPALRSVGRAKAAAAKWYQKCIFLPKGNRHSVAASNQKNVIVSFIFALFAWIAWYDEMVGARCLAFVVFVFHFPFVGKALLSKMPCLWLPFSILITYFYLKIRCYFGQRYTMPCHALYLLSLLPIFRCSSTLCRFTYIFFLSLRFCSFVN